MTSKQQKKLQKKVRSSQSYLLKEVKITNDVKIQKAGFDLKTSFRK